MHLVPILLLIVIAGAIAGATGSENEPDRAALTERFGPPVEQEVASRIAPAATGWESALDLLGPGLENPGREDKGSPCVSYWIAGTEFVAENGETLANTFEICQRDGRVVNVFNTIQR